MKMIFSVLIAVAWLVMPQSANAQLKDKYQSCTGFLGLDINATDLEWTSVSHAWLCHAVEIPTELLEKVLKVCQPQVRCQIKGTVSGRGAFQWSKIYSVKKVAMPKGWDT